MTSSSALGEFENLCYVLVEDCESRGLHTSSLTEALVARKNVEWTVTVELDFQPSAAENEHKSDGGVEDSIDTSPMTHVQVHTISYILYHIIFLPFVHLLFDEHSLPLFARYSSRFQST